MNKTVSLFLVSLFVGLLSVGLVLLFLIEPPAEADIEYSEYDFDYIIPRPWYSQITEITDLEFVDKIIPFYLYRSASSDRTKLNFDLILIDNKEASDRFLPNVRNDNSCIVDKRFADICGVTIGDEIIFEFFDTNQTRKISDIISAYPFSSRPTVFIELTGIDKTLLTTNISHLSYSGAYVQVNNFQLADNYFYYKYYPLGKVGNPLWYDNFESYQYMLNSITTTTAVNEIISVEPLRIQQSQALSDYYAKKDFNFAFTCLFISLLNSLIWIAVLQINNRNDMTLLVLGYKSSAIFKRYIISFVVTGLVASIGSFLYMHYYDLRYAITYEVIVLCNVILLSLIAYRKVYRKAMKSTD